MCVYFEKVASHSVATPGINGIRCMKQVAQEASVRSEPLRRGYVNAPMEEFKETIVFDN